MLRLSSDYIAEFSMTVSQYLGSMLIVDNYYYLLTKNFVKERVVLISTRYCVTIKGAHILLYVSCITSNVY